MEKHSAYYELLGQLASPDCPVCALARRRTLGFLERYLDESVVHEDTWDRLKAAGGWCGRHAGQVAGFKDGLGVAIFHEHMLRQAAAALDKGGAPEVPAPPTAWQRLRGAKRPPCPACEVEADTEASQARLLAAALEEPEFRAAMEAHPGLCRPHTAAVLARLEGGAREAFGRQQAARLRALADELQTYIRKSEHGAREPLGDEADSWVRALRRWHGLGLGG